MTRGDELIAFKWLLAAACRGDISKADVAIEMPEAPVVAPVVPMVARTAAQWEVVIAGMREREIGYDFVPHWHYAALRDAEAALWAARAAEGEKVAA